MIQDSPMLNMKRKSTSVSETSHLTNNSQMSLPEKYVDQFRDDFDTAEHQETNRRTRSRSEILTQGSGSADTDLTPGHTPCSSSSDPADLPHSSANGAPKETEEEEMGSRKSTLESEFVMRQEQLPMIGTDNRKMYIR